VSAVAVPVVGVDAITDVSLECRDLGHAWKFVNDATLRKRRGGPSVIERQLRCLRCGMERLDTMRVPSFEVESRRYVQPEGYRTRGLGAVSVTAVRMEAWRRSHGGQVPR
jgi:hypothetical protein